MASLATLLQCFQDVLGPDLGAKEVADALYLASRGLVTLEEVNKKQGAKKNQDQDNTVTKNFPGSGGADRSISNENEKAPYESRGMDEKQIKQPEEIELFADALETVRRIEGFGIPPPRLLAATQLRVPSGRALSNALAIGRALRPVMRRVPSRTDFVLDLEATVEKVVAADLSRSRDWEPQFRPKAIRWLSVDLVVDSAQTMGPWRETVEEFSKLLENSGGFRTVRRWVLDTDGQVRSELCLSYRCDMNSTVRLKYGVASAEATLRGVEPESIGQRLILVMTDCTGQSWHDGTAWELMAACGRFAAAAVVQTLPEPLWERTATRPRDVWVRAGQPGACNQNLPRSFDVPLTGSELEEDFWEWPITPSATTTDGIENIPGRTSVSLRSIPVPILTLDPVQIVPWARLVAGRSGDLVPAALVSLRAAAASPNDEASYVGTPDKVIPGLIRSPRIVPPTEPSTFEARLRVEAFRLASPLAQRLALRLTAAEPLCLPIIRVVRDALLPAATEAHIAEILMSGLLQEVNGNERKSPATSTGQTVSRSKNAVALYEWRLGVREELAKSLREGESLQVSRQVGDWIGQRAGSPRDFTALVQDPSGTATLILNERTESFARLTVGNLQRLGFRDAAADLGERLSDYQDAEGSPGLSVQRTIKGRGRLIFRLAWSPNGLTLATPDINGTICLWNAATGELLSEIKVSKLGVNQITWSPNGQHMAAACFDRITRVWKISSDCRQAYLRKELKNHQSDVRCAAWSPDGDLLATGTAGGSVRFFDTQNWQTLSHWYQKACHGVNVLAWSPDGTELGFGCEDGYTRTIRRDDLQRIHQQEPASKSHHPITAIGWLPQRDLLIAGTAKGVLYSPSIGTDHEDRAAATIPREIHAHETAVMAVSFSPCGSVVVSKGADGWVRLFRSDTWEQVAQLPEPTPYFTLAGLAWNPQYSMLASLTDQGRSVRLWQVDMSRLLPEPVVLSRQIERPISVAPKAPIEPSSDFLSEQEIRDQINGSLERVGTVVDIVKETLLIFATSKQHTWLVTTRQQLFCLLDDPKSVPQVKLIQWDLPLRGAEPVKAHMVTTRSGNLAPVVDIGTHKNWLYSSDRFRAGSDIEQAIREMIARSLGATPVKAPRNLLREWRYDVFITYRAKNAGLFHALGLGKPSGYVWFQDVLLPQFQEASISYFIFPDSVKGTSYKKEVISEAIERSHSHLLIVAPGFTWGKRSQSEIAKREEIGERGRIIPILIGDREKTWDEFANLRPIEFPAVPNISLEKSALFHQAFQELTARLREHREIDLREASIPIHRANDPVPWV